MRYPLDLDPTDQIEHDKWAGHKTFSADRRLAAHKEIPLILSLPRSRDGDIDVRRRRRQGYPSLALPLPLSDLVDRQVLIGRPKLPR